MSYKLQKNGHQYAIEIAKFINDAYKTIGSAYMNIFDCSSTTNGLNLLFKMMYISLKRTHVYLKIEDYI